MIFFINFIKLYCIIVFTLRYRKNDFRLSFNHAIYKSGLCISHQTKKGVFFTWQHYQNCNSYDAHYLSLTLLSSLFLFQVSIYYVCLLIYCFFQNVKQDIFFILNIFNYVKQTFIRLVFCS